MATKKFNPQDHMMDMRGKQYLEVKWRIVWFRSDHPNGRIDTDVRSHDPLLVQATVFNNDGQHLATGHGSANPGKKNVVWTGREFEKAETAAIGRALAHAGYGTQFTGEVEGEHLADSPQEATGRPPQGDSGATDTNTHWISQEGVSAKFWMFTKGLNLTKDEVHAALKVDSVKQFAGTMDDAKALLQDAGKAKHEAMVEAENSVLEEAMGHDADPK